MVQSIRKNRVAFADQCRYDAGVGGIAGVKVQRARQAHKAGQRMLQCVISSAVPADQR